MTLRMKTMRLVAVGGAMVVALGAPASGRQQGLAMLDGLDAGRWELRVRNSGRETERLCVSNGRRFIQLRHPDAACDRFVLQDDPQAVTVQYTCRGKGYGRTEIRRETSRLVQIQSQGIVAGLPFDFTAEARRVGDCAA